VEVAAGERPVERRGSGGEFGLEAEDAAGEVVDVVEVAGRERLALEDREGDLDLVEPRGVPGSRWMVPLSTTQNTRCAEA
jgi:hypothetical protein